MPALLGKERKYHAFSILSPGDPEVFISLFSFASFSVASSLVYVCPFHLPLPHIHGNI